MPDSRILRALVVPVVITLVFFTFARACTSSVRRTRASEIEAMQRPASPAVAAAPARKFGEIDYPAGLDAERIGYLVSIHPEFSQPLTATAYKRAGDYDRTGYALRSLGYMSRNEEGNMVLTREGLTNLSIAQETAETWTFTIAKRVFDRVTAVQSVESRTVRVTVSWHWDVSPAATQLGVRDSGWGAVAEFAGNDGQWTLTRWVSSLDAGT